MTEETPPPPPERLERWSKAAQWLMLLAVSALFSVVLEVFHVPAALLIAPMAAAIIVGVNGATVRVPKPVFVAAQAIVGVLVAASIEPAIFGAIAADWPLLAIATLATIGASSFLGWLISRWRILPGTTGVWGSAPGAATAMVLMAEAFGADARLVAFMQYLRVIIVTAAAAFIARLWVDTSGVEVAPTIWFPPIDWMPFAATVLIAVGGVAIARWVKLPSPNFMGVFLLGLILHLGAGVPFQLPQWLLALSYVTVGWSIGLNFTRPVLVHAVRSLPFVLAAIAALMIVCGAMAWVLVQALGIDPLTAYLATSPGGMDSVAIIAAASDAVDISFVMAMQLARFLFVLLFGPALARFVARQIRD
ncbi:MAG TPA: AbrB family transcriptional regulator [Rhizobiaceae bacterium]|nr:AbrB family transcriptional regulator [Rhizobiaceae bacterium]